jgi:hypothetical protein
VTTGNITNDVLLELVSASLTGLTHAFGSSDLVELGRDALVLHERRLD